MKQIEILAPAGSMESLIGAINAGAKAVYLAGRRFGARAYASNFSDEKLISVIHYAHVRGVFVYVAINTIVFDDEIDDLIAYTDFLVKHNADAFIIQDLGVMHLLRKRYPNMTLHASTQVNAHSVNQVKCLKELGIKRVVLARETPFEVIKQIKKQVDIELEVFVHGALCVCYSGNCLMSSMIGGRSGNRGECAQPCRLPYTLIKDHQIISDQTYLLSTKDLMTIDYIKELIDLGIDSIKIEGRMRKPEYVIQAVKSYKSAIDHILYQKDVNLEVEKDRLMRVFNRDFTEGFMFESQKKNINQDLRPNHMGVHAGAVIDYKKNKATIKLTEPLRINDGYRILGQKDYGDVVSRILLKHQLTPEAKPGDMIILDVKEPVEIGSPFLKTLDIKLEEDLSIYLNPHFKLIPLSMHIEAHQGKKLFLHLSDGMHHMSLSSKDVLQEAKTNPVSKQMIQDQMTKLGQTPFFVEHIEIISDEKAFIPVKVMNDLRRDALSMLIKERTSKDEISISVPQFQDVIIPLSSFEHVVKVTQKSQLEALKDDDLHIYIEDRLMIDSYPKHYSIMQKRIQLRQQPLKHSSTVVHEIGSLNLELGKDIITSEFLNVSNIYTAHLLFLNGAKRVTLSLELSRERSKMFVQNYKKQFNQHPNLEYVVYGRPELMISKYCPIQKTFKTKDNCLLCEKNQYELKDRVGMKFPLIHDGQCNIRIMHQKPLNLFQYVHELKEAGIMACRIDLTTEKADEIKHILKNYRQSLFDEIIISNPAQYSYGRYLK